MEQNIAIATALAAEIRHQQQLHEITNPSASPTTATMTKSSVYNNNSLVTLRDIILKQHLQQFNDDPQRQPPDEELPTNLTLRPKDFSRLKDTSAADLYQRDLLMRHHDLKRNLTSHDLTDAPDTDGDEDVPRKKVARGRSQI
jgi:hypothetical protein